MNFDGTYQEAPYVSEKHRMLGDTNIQETRPPVRVIVSYPQSEEWDGKPVQQWRKYWFWIGLTILISTVAFGTFYLVIQYLKTSVNQSSEIEILVKAPADHRSLVSEYVLKKYEDRARGDDFATQLEFFKNELDKLENTDDFLTDFSIPYKHLNANETNDVMEKLTGYLEARKDCLTKLAFEEITLSSYEFQKKPSVRENLNMEDCSYGEKAHVEKLRNEYGRPESVIRHGSSLIVHGKVLILKKVKNLLDPTIRQLTIIASVLYLDTDITRNMDIAIFAKNWRFITTPVEFNLSGPDATDNHLDVHDSQPGKSGFDSGFFLAVGLTNMDNETLTVRLDGGNASDGHDGPHGENGTAGVLPKMLVGEQSCVVPLEDGFINPARESLQKHAVFDERACAEAGGLGGLAGLPGQGGEAVLISSDDQRYLHVVGSDGDGAKNGTNGKNGTSIPGECYTIAYKYFPFPGEPPRWHTVTAASCHPENPYKLPLIPNRKSNHTQQPEIRIPKNITVFQQSLKVFSDMARKNFSENSRELFTLLELIESNKHLANACSVTELEDEFNTLDNTYNQIEIFQSFARKVALARKANGNNRELADLEAMVWSKIAALNTRFGVHYVVDIESYLQETLNSLRKMDTEKSSYPLVVQNKLNEVVKKLHEAKKLLQPVPENRNGTDEGVAITAMILPQFVDVLVGVLENRLDVSFKKLRHTLDGFQTKLEQSCRQEDPMPLENLLTLEKCTVNRKIDKRLLGAFYAIRNDRPVDGIAVALGAIERELQPSIAATPVVKNWIVNVRVAVSDLSSLLFRIRQSITETKLATVVAEINGRGRSKNGNMHRVLKNLSFQQYLKALDAYKQWAFPYCDLKETLTADATRQELILATQTIIDTLKTDRTTIQARDNQVIEAQFRLSSPIAPFYTWTRHDNDNEITRLLQGHRVEFTALLADSVHGLSKQAIKFRTAEIHLEGIPKSITKNFEVHLTHSGFSHFLYNGTITTIIGPEIEIVHSLDFTHGEPTSRNSVYQKIKAGDVFLSPYTTWFVQLKALNDQARFEDFETYSTTNVHLVGIGRYTSP